MRICNMLSDNGNKVPNQFIVTTDRGEYFVSYESTIAFIDKEGKTYLDKYNYNYSRTTSKYLNRFLDCTIKEREERIKKGEYILTTLGEVE